MVLTFRHSAWIIEFRREKLPRALTWALLVILALGFAYVYLADGLPSPYGVCYASRGHPKPCGTVTTKAVDAKALPVQRP